MKELRKDLAKYTVLQSSECQVPLPSHLRKNCFTLAAMDNFGNAGKNSSSKRMHAHDTAITLFQVQPDKHIQKLPKDSLDLTNAPNLNKLLCQTIYSFHSSQKLPLSESFRVQNELYLDQTSEDVFEKYEFIISSSQNIIPESKDSIIPSWTGIRALLSNTFVPKMHVGFLSFLPSPVTEYFTVFSAIKNVT